jgi:GR25 family glycosyltransferase involved in LPS biosynthesis
MASRQALLRKLDAAREDNRTWRRELNRKHRQLEGMKHKGQLQRDEDQQRYDTALAQEQRTAEAVHRELRSEEQRHRNLSLEVSALRGMVSAAQAELGELEEKIQQEKQQVEAAYAERQPNRASRLQLEMGSSSASPAARPAAVPASSLASTSAEPGPSSDGPLVLVINLDRRTDRLERVLSLPWGLRPTRLPAVDGTTLEWNELVANGQLSEAAAADSRWAEQTGLPTVCRETGSFSPHLTKAGVGCALSHRAAWDRLSSHPMCEWALIVEDDLDALAPSFEPQLRAVIRQLPRTWQICYVGYHESSGRLLPASEQPKVMEAAGDGMLTGLFGYLLRRSAAQALLHDPSLLPLRHQIDVALSQRAWPRSSRFALAPGGVLLSSPRSEEGECDTDVQTLGQPGVRAHEQLPTDWLRSSGTRLLS